MQYIVEKVGIEFCDVVEGVKNCCDQINVYIRMDRNGFIHIGRLTLKLIFEVEKCHSGLSQPSHLISTVCYYVNMYVIILR